VRLLLERIDGRSAGWLDEVSTRIADGRTADLVARFAGSRLERSVRDPQNDLGQWVGALDPAVPRPRWPPARGQPPIPRRRRLLIERLSPERAPLLLFGAGHVGQAVARQFAPLAFDLAWFDSRPETAQAGAAIISEAQMEAAAAAAPSGGFV
jgi:xanthine dehydrogenase accessory factor